MTSPTDDPVDLSQKRILVVFAAAVVVVVLGFFEYPPLQDYAEWMYQSYILSDLMSGHAVHLFYVREYPVPYLLTQVVMSAFSLGLGPLWGSRLTIAVYVLLGVLLSISFTRRYRLNPRIAYPFLMCAIVCNSCFWSGYINYQVGLLVLMAYLSLAEHHREKALVTVAFGLLAFSCHPFCMLAFVIIGGCLALDKGGRAVVLFGFACVPMIALTVWYLLARHDDAMAEQPPVVRYFSTAFFFYKFYTLAKAGPYQNFLVDGIGDHDREPVFYAVGVATNLLMGLLLMGLVIRKFRWVDETGSFGWSLAILCLALAYLLAPARSMQVVNPGERVLYPLLLCSLRVCARSGSAATARSWSRLVPTAIYLMMGASIAGLFHATHWHNPGTAVTDPRGNDPPENARAALFGHKPYDFHGQFDTMVAAYEQRTEPSRPLAFPTSILAERTAVPSAP